MSLKNMNKIKGR